MTIWLRRMRDGPKLALSRGKETESPTRLSDSEEERGLNCCNATQATDEVVSGMTLCILIDRICDLKMFFVNHR